MVVIVLFMKYQIEYKTFILVMGVKGDFILSKGFYQRKLNHEKCIKSSIENQRHTKLISQYITTTSICILLFITY